MDDLMYSLCHLLTLNVVVFKTFFKVYEFLNEMKRLFKTFPSFRFI